MNNKEGVFKLIVDSKVKVKKSSGRCYFSLKSYRAVMPAILGSKFLKLNQRRNYNLIRQLIDIYKDEIVTNF